MKGSRILYCHCAYAQIIPRDVKSAVLRGLVESGVAFDAVGDLCDMSARKDPALGDLATADGGIRIAACYPRAVKWLFHAAGAPLPPEKVEIFNMRKADAAATVDGLLERTAAPGAPGSDAREETP